MIKEQSLEFSLLEKMEVEAQKKFVVKVMEA